MKTCLAVSTASFAMSLLLLVVPGTCRAQNLFVANYNSNIEEYNSSGEGIGNFPLFGSSLDARALAFDSAGNLYVANDADNTIVKFLYSNGALSPSGTVFASSGLSEPDALAFDSSGNLYVANFYPGNIEKFSSSGTDLGQFYGTPGQVYPRALAFDSTGDLFLANAGNNTIMKFTYSNGVLSPSGTVFASSDLDDPRSLAFDRAGNLYVANFYADIEMFNSSGGDLGMFPNLESTPNNPWGMAFDSAGNLYVAYDGNNTIEKYSSSGVGTVFAAGPGEPDGLAFQPVPEPSTWAMVAMSLGAILGGLRLRRSS